MTTQYFFTTHEDQIFLLVYYVRLAAIQGKTAYKFEPELNTQSSFQITLNSFQVINYIQITMYGLSRIVNQLFT